MRVTKAGKKKEEANFDSKSSKKRHSKVGWDHYIGYRDIGLVHQDIKLVCLGCLLS